MENKNFILAVLISGAFLLVWSFFVMPHFAPPPAPTAVTSTTATGVATQDGSAPTAVPVVPGASGAATLIPSEKEFSTDQNSLTLLSIGGGLEHWRLNFKGQVVDLVDHPGQTPAPLSAFPDVPVTIHNDGQSVVTVGDIQKGVRLTKTLTVSPKDFLHKLSFRFDNQTDQPLELKNWEWGWGPGLGTAENEKKDNPGLTRVLTLGLLKADVIKEHDTPTVGKWIGIDNRYFLVAFFPEASDHPSAYVTGVHDQAQLHIVENTIVPAHGQTTIHYQMYVGPKGYTHLKTYGLGLEESVDFGTFSPIGKFILSILYHLKNWTGNYGWSIIILTMALQILLIPLSLKSFRAQLGMKRLQPQIAALQAKYKGDPKRLNVEMLNIYKKSKTNPFGGCLPMLLQLPIFWALFTTLRNAYELRGAPWIGWIHDLSAADPLHILPIIMGGGMYFQQRLSGAVTDPTQRQMMIMMPIMFTFMFFNFPAGLVLYWLTNSLMTMLFQFIFIETHKQPTTPATVVDTTIVK